MIYFHKCIWTLITKQDDGVFVFAVLEIPLSIIPN